MTNIRGRAYTVGEMKTTGKDPQREWTSTQVLTETWQAAMRIKTALKRVPLYEVFRRAMEEYERNHPNGSD